MTQGRALLKSEIELIWRIERRELIERIYGHQHDRLVLREERYDMQGWPPGEAEKSTPLLVDCHERGGWFYGIFDGAVLVGAAILDNRFLGTPGRKLQLSFLHVSHSHRKQGLGRRLFLLAKEKAREWNATHLYISATPSENTVHFYQRLGCSLATEVDPSLFKLEPVDIHFECSL